MWRRRIEILTTVAVLSLAATAPRALAAPPAPAPKAESAKVGGGREKMLREKVGLDAAKAKQVATLLEAQKAARKPARAAIKAAFGALKDLVKAGKADDAAYVAANAKVLAAREKLHALELEQQAAVGKLLTPGEHARYLLATRKTKKAGKDDKPAAKVDPKAKATPAPAKDDDDDDDGPD